MDCTFCVLEVRWWSLVWDGQELGCNSPSELCRDNTTCWQYHLQTDTNSITNCAVTTAPDGSISYKQTPTALPTVLWQHHLLAVSPTDTNSITNCAVTTPPVGSITYKQTPTALPTVPWQHHLLAVSPTNRHQQHYQLCRDNTTCWQYHLQTNTNSITNCVVTTPPVGSVTYKQQTPTALPTVPWQHHLLAVLPINNRHQQHYQLCRDNTTCWHITYKQQTPTALPTVSWQHHLLAYHLQTTDTNSITNCVVTTPPVGISPTNNRHQQHYQLCRDNTTCWHITYKQQTPTALPTAETK